MSNKIETHLMETGDICEAINLWKKQAQYFNTGKTVYPFWENKYDGIELHLKNSISNGNALAAKQSEKLAGFITFDIFDFHGALSAMCHFIGTAATTTENRQHIYLALYNKLCEHCVSKGALAHYIAICPDDLEIRELLFNLGFGGYVIFALAQFNQSM